MERSSLNPEDFPSNKMSDKTANKNLKPVVKTKAITRKKPISKRLAEMFIGEDVDNVAEYVVVDVLIPAAKNMLSDAVTTSVQMLLFGDDRGSRGNRIERRGDRSYVSYSGYYKDREDKRRDRSRVNRARHNFDDIILGTRGEAEEVLSCLIDLIDEYEVASVADLYELIGVTSSFTDNKWGWDNLSTASVRRIRDGYLIDLPRPIMLD